MHHRRLLAILTLAALLAASATGGAAAQSPQPALGPSNPAAAAPAVTLHVTTGGIQRVTGADLAAAGMSLAATAPSSLQLRRAGAPVPIELRGADDGRLDPGDELRFYAPPPGDRWNAADTYWLAPEAAPGARMAARAAPPAGAAARSSAFVSGTWRDNQLYEPGRPGADGDHWFAADLSTGPGQPPAALAATLAPDLPLAAGAMSVTVTGTAYAAGSHTLDVSAGAGTARSQWSGAGDFARTVSVPAGAQVTLTLVPGAALDGLELDGITWQAPATLSFGGRGARFEGASGSWTYQLSGLAAGQELYDITDPAQPARITGWSGAFQDGPAARSYLVTGDGTLHAPAARAYAPLPLPAAADVVYIAPAALHAALAPLLAHRRAQGLAAEAVDVQALYDRWSYGQVAPEAIRAFLRYAAASWAAPPRAAVLVGDGTSDPLNYTGRNNPNLIPPYLAMVDPWLGETACETCFGQLDGADPLSDAMPDMATGRLPVKSAAELQALVAKIIGYETAAGGTDWRARAVLLADNGTKADGTPDSAGDFAALSDMTLDLLPPGAVAQRLYYDPWKRTADGTPRADTWREPDAAKARQRAIALLNQGAGIVAYQGHGHQWQWAVTDSSASSWLLGVYDVDALTNGERLPIVLALTCLTSAFQTPAFSGTTVDERLVLKQDGGAIAVWGATGQGVAHGHDALQRGFLRELWAAHTSPPTLGDLTLAGYRELLTTTTCCADMARTFALLGDPMTPARVPLPAPVFLPVAGR